jgi:hypothetical protein
MTDSTDKISIENNYFDSNGKKLNKGFYKSHGANNLLHFEGDYNSEGLPNFERENENTFEIEALNSQLVRRLYRIGKEEVRNKLANIKKKTEWIEKRLKD